MPDPETLVSYIISAGPTSYTIGRGTFSFRGGEVVVGIHFSRVSEIKLEKEEIGVRNE